jgi:heme/copper-type cytochrome/quinol oxidase subunit 2
LKEAFLEVGGFRLLETDNVLVLPAREQLLILVTSSDVLHSWSVPSLGVKIDACPGRLNRVSLSIKREGWYFGQCSELCGANHGFMPIAIEAVSADVYLN